MDNLLTFLRNARRRQRVRPWAMAAPILVLLVALPLLRPLRNPDPRTAADNELSRLATVQAMAENRAQNIDGTLFFESLQERHFSRRPPDTFRMAGKYYSDKPPVLAAILAGMYIVMGWFGLSLQQHLGLVTYLLTVLGATIPVAASAGLIYRMGRLFELKRPWRTALAIIVVFGSGLISYSVVINSHAPAAALVLAACACLVHIISSKTARQTGAWLMVAGLCASLAAVIDIAALVFLVGLVFVILAMRWGKTKRFSAVLLYAIGSLPPLALHAVLTVPLTGNLFPPHLQQVRYADLNAAPDPAADDDVPAAPTASWLRRAVEAGERLVSALVGSRGLFSHFPVILVGLSGIALVLRRHWPATTKMLAGVTLVCGAGIVGAYVFFQVDWSQAMFGPRWFIVFLPLVLFWSGAWLRRPHSALAWGVALLLLGFSVAVSLVGATDPFVNAGPDRYSAGVALRELLHPQTAGADAADRAALARGG